MSAVADDRQEEVVAIDLAARALSELVVDSTFLVVRSVQAAHSVAGRDTAAHEVAMAARTVHTRRVAALEDASSDLMVADMVLDSLLASLLPHLYTSILCFHRWRRSEA